MDIAPSHQVVFSVQGTAWSRTPNEVWERILDFASSKTGSRHARFALGRCLVCKAWLNRGIYNLYRVVELSVRGIYRRGGAPNIVHRFHQTISRYPHLAGIVEELYVTHPILNITISTNHIPHTIAIGPSNFSRKLQNLRKVAFQEVDWSYPHPCRVRVMASFKALDCLVLDSNVFGTVSDVFRLMWSMPLRSLTMNNPTISRPMGSRELARLSYQAATLTPKCEQLETLRLIVSSISN